MQSGTIKVYKQSRMPCYPKATRTKGPVRHEPRCCNSTPSKSRSPKAARLLQSLNERPTTHDEKEKEKPNQLNIKIANQKAPGYGYKLCPRSSTLRSYNKTKHTPIIHFMILQQNPIIHFTILQHTNTLQTLGAHAYKIILFNGVGSILLRTAPWSISQALVE